MSRRRSWSPPTLVCTTWRMVVSATVGVPVSGVALGAAAHVPTCWGAAAPAAAETASSSRIPSSAAPVLLFVTLASLGPKHF
ncbi:hypothetical protein [Saccharopolyspora mangrovi]|uniref:Secreted protein n=1 Tax=Saccharopolyspora mangrovi TaxID=3082379 RepID=A0ABU6AJC7_9PSEU|nr:hypothetical protein [Saccharopolyspora sp. S2-29]MEB3371663.1 hypothetical protein [Saccharopolyspora sp. S2-29]